jgi:hypothetical protein
MAERRETHGDHDMKRLCEIAAIILLGCSGIRCSYFWDKEFVIEITEEQIQEKLDAQFPISEEYLLIFRLTLADPEVALEEGSDRIGLGVSAFTNVRVDDEELTGQANIATKIRYNPQKGSLHLVDPQVENLTISLLPEKYEDAVMLAAGVSTNKFLDDYEIYRLDQSDFKQRMAKLVLKDVVVKDGVLRVTLSLAH